MSENEPPRDESTSGKRYVEGEDAGTSGAEATNPNGMTGDEHSDAGSGKTTEGSFEEPSDDLVERIADSDPNQLAREIESFRAKADEQQDTIDELEATIDDLESRLKRTQADFQNYKKRMEKRRKQERKRATEDLITRIIDVRDNLKRGLEQDGEIREGIETTLRQFDRTLEQENVAEITPEPGEDIDPQRHEVLMRVDSDQPEDTIDAVHRSGYEMADKVIREAQVTVSDGESDSN